jgi:DNA-binding LytR/AlgR family response regulator
VDDERPARERLKRLVGALPGVEIVGEAADGRQALEQVAALAPDAVFLDVEMPELTGLEVAATLGGDGPAVVFCTAYDQYALKAFEVSAVDYLLKPVDADRLAAAVERLKQAQHRPALAGLTELVQRLSGQPRMARLAVRTGARFVVCDLATVSAVVAKDHYSEIIWGERRILADDSLDAIEARVVVGDFLRIHRGSLINLKYLKELRREGDRKYLAVLDDAFATELPVSRDRLGALKGALGLGAEPG